MTTTWDSQDAAMGMRDAIAAIADKRINTLRPEISYAVVQTINREARSAKVLYMGDTDPVTVALGSIEPATVGQTVRIGGTLGHRYVEDVLGNAIMSGNDSRYAQTGHTHAGGGAVELDLNDLSDVDTETNPPGASSVLGWNNVGGFWHPISIDLGTAYLALTGGTVTGPTTFQSSLAVGTTLNVGGAVTGQSFSGVGAALTNLNAGALASGTIPVGRFPTTIGSNTTGTAAAWTTGRLLTVVGDMTGTVTLKGDADMSLSVALQPNSIDLGTDTTGNYVAHIIGTANQIISNTVVAGEGTTHTLSLPQSIHVNAVPTFMRVALGQATGTAPMTVTSTTMVPNLTVNYLGAVGQDAAFFQNAGNLTAGTVPSARLTGAYTGITGLGTLTTLTVAGVAALGNNSTVAGQTIWHAGNDGAGSGLDAGLLGGVLPIGYASTEIVESLMGDLLAVGLYDAEAYNGDKFSIIFDRPTHQTITGLTVATGDQAIDFRFDADLPVIPQVDVAANAARRVILRTAGTFQIAYIRTGDDDYLNRTTSAASTPHDETLILPSTFTIRARVRKTLLTSATERVIARHGADPGNLAWKLAVLNGTLVFTASSNGTTLTPVVVLTAPELDAISGTADNTDFYVAVVVTRNGTNLLARGWGSVNGTVWTTAAAQKSVAYAFTTFFDPAAALWVGGQAAATAWDGRIYWVDAIADSDPNGRGLPVFRFDASEHPYGGGVSYADPAGRTWTVSSATAFVHATYTIQAIVPTSGGDRTMISPAFSYAFGVGRPWHIRLTWNPTTDVMTIGHRSGESLALDAATPAFTDTSTTFTGTALSTIGAVTIGEGTGPLSVNWSFGGRFRRAFLSKNAATILDLRHTNLTVAGQTVITPTVGPVMTMSANTMAMTTMPKPVWAEGPTVYRHNMYWIVASTGELDFIDSDLSGRYEIGVDEAVTVSNGDWIVAVDPLFGSPGHEEGANLTLNDLTFQYIPFSTETFVKTQIHDHASDVLDPHSAAGYLKAVIANALYAPLVHTHAAEISGYIGLHESASNPHPIYLTQAEGDGLYLKPGDIQPYEPLGSVLAHEQKADPHPQYVSHSEGNAAYAVVTHGHTEFAQAGHTHPTDYEVLSTDGAQSARIFMGDDAPVGPRVGDLWIQTFDILLQPPLAPTGLVVSATAPTTITLTWNAWDPTVAQSGVQVERSPDGSTGWVQVFQDLTTPYAVTFTDTGRAERTTYFYRVRALNATGNGIWGSISAATTNAPPNAPTGLSASNVTPTSIRLNWVAVTGPPNDPMHATPYEVFRNGISLGFTASLFWDHTGLVENTAYTLGVRARDNLVVYSATSSISASTSNAAPPAPTGLFTGGKNHYQIHTGWSAVSGISDFNRYQAFVNGGFVADVYATNYLFSGLNPSTAYTLGIRSVDNSGAVSGLATYVDSTTVNPDTTPPGPITMHGWYPRNNYGEMYFDFSCPGDIAYGEIFYNINGTGWVVTYQGGLGGRHVHYNGTHAAGNTVYAAVNYRDAAGNWYYSPHYAYTLVASPTNFGAHSSSSWRPINGGHWNAAGTNKVYQGYFSDPNQNSWGFWFYGRDFQNWWQANRTLTSASIFINREGCGYNQQDVVTLYVHQIEENPGDVAFWGTPGLAGGQDIGTIQYGEAKWMSIPLQWMYDAMGGTWRGFAIARGDGKPYLCLYPSHLGYSGVVEVTHLG